MSALKLQDKLFRYEYLEGLKSRFSTDLDFTVH